MFDHGVRVFQAWTYVTVLIRRRGMGGDSVHYRQGRPGAAWERHVGYIARLCVYGLSLMSRDIVVSVYAATRNVRCHECLFIGGCMCVDAGREVVVRQVDDG